jgi:hypothetical protein
MTRVAGSLVTSQVRAYDLLRMLGRDGHPSALGQAFAEYGRIAKTLHLLAFVDPPTRATGAPSTGSSLPSSPVTGWHERSSMASTASSARPTAGPGGPARGRR